MSTPTNDIQRIGLIGFGTIGAGIAEVVAASGREVVIVATDGSRLIDGAATISDLSGVDLVIEAVTEDAEVKKAVLAEVCSVVGADIPVVTTTSTLSVTELAATLPNPARIAGLHFFDPVPLMRTVEVVRALQTDEDLIERLVAFVDSLADKDAIRVKDHPGFLVNSMLLPYLNDVIAEYDDELATAEDIDVALKLGLGYKTGPFEMLDRIGLDVHLRATEAAYTATGQPGYAAPPLLRRMVAAGRLGDKTGHGFRSTPTISDTDTKEPLT